MCSWKPISWRRNQKEDQEVSWNKWIHKQKLVNSNKSYIKKQERTPMKNLTLHLLEPEKNTN